MAELEVIKTYPIGSILTREESEDAQYLQKIKRLTPELRSFIASPKTSAFIRGLGKSYDVLPEKIPLIAFEVLQIAIGDRKTSQLIQDLSQELSLPLPEATQMAKEIEELFSPYMLSLNSANQEQSNSTTHPLETPNLQAGGARNVLDLKTQNRPPVPPPIPSR